MTRREEAPHEAAARSMGASALSSREAIALSRTLRDYTDEQNLSADERLRAIAIHAAERLTDLIETGDRPAIAEAVTVARNLVVVLLTAQSSAATAAPVAS